MKVETAVYPTSDQLQRLGSQTAEGPIFIVNLLKFREKAIYKHGQSDNISWAEAYILLLI
jgi:hypothetical protein